MKNLFRKLWLVVIGAVIVPIILYAVYEVSSLSDHEQQIQESYDRQLESILFSVNLYTEDRVGSMATWLENKWRQNLDSFPIGEQANLYPYVAQTWLVKLHDQLPEKVYVSPDTTSQTEQAVLFKTFTEFVRSLPTDQVGKLVNYRKNGFRKIEALGKVPENGREMHAWAFVPLIQDEPYLCVIFFHTQQLLEQVVIPKLQDVGRQDFSLSLKKIGADSPVFAFDNYDGYDLQTRNLWLLKDYNVTISLPVLTISDMVNDRVARNLIALLLLLAVLLLGMFLIYRNIQKEMAFAQAKAEFVSNVSHEIRTPLALISMFGETLLLGRVPTEKRKQEYYEIICKETARLTNIVNRILNFSKMEAGKKEFEMVHHDLTTLVSEVVNTYSYHLESNQFACITQYSETALPILADQEAITETVVNLIDNAMKYSPNEKEITITTRLKQQRALFEIADKGIGMTHEQAKHIFDKFYRAPQGNIHNTKGAGLGLSIVKQIVALHKGEITVESTPGKGSKFVLSFPLLPMQASLPAQSASG